MIENCLNYFTTWSLIVSLIIFVLTFIINIPGWLFLFAACILTTTSIVGSLFITLPNMNYTTVSMNVGREDIILVDSLIHVVPLLIFLFFFGKFKFTRNFSLLKTLLVSVLVVFIYNCYIQFENKYDKFDSLTLGILSLSVFLSSYQVYIKLINQKL
jgi:hypothetical protein